MMDVLRFSNRFVGPVFRTRMALKELAIGRPVEPLQFRDDDYWRDLARDLNAVSQQVEGYRTSQTGE
jgi:hypothetical protein